GCSERIIYPLTVTVYDTLLTYTYAFVMENAGTSHTNAEMPYVEFMILNTNGDTIPGTHMRISGNTNLPGIYSGKCYVNGPTNPIYKPWTNVQLNLTNYIGQSLSIVITNADCSQG